MRVDLSADTAVTTALLRDPLAWRIRAVEHIDFDTASSCARRRSLQCAPLRPVLRRQVPKRADSALLSLHFASVPRGALVDLDVTGPGDAEAFLLPRKEIAAREAAFLRSLAKDIGLTVSADLLELMTALLAHTTTAWEISTQARPLDRPAEYLADGFGQAISKQQVDRWLTLDAEAARLLTPFADQLRGVSPTEHPLLGLPSLDLPEASLESTVQRVDRALRSYLQLLRSTAAAAEPGTIATDLLTSLADYGRNYDLIAVTTVPLDDPFVLKYSERRDAEVGEHGLVTQDVVLADAGSNHVMLTSPDANVRIVDAQARTPDGEDEAFGAFGTRHSAQSYAVYAHADDRDYRVLFKVQLRAIGRVQGTIYTAAGVLGAVAVAIVIEHPHALRDLALIVGPISLAASVLLIREPTTLGSRLRSASSRALIIALASLLAVSTLSYLWPKLTAIAGTLAAIAATTRW